MTLDDVIARLKAQIEEAGGASAWAATKQLSPSYVSDILNRRKDPGAGFLAALGMVRIVTYEDVP